MRALLALLADVSGATPVLREAEAQRGRARQETAVLRVALAQADRQVATTQAELSNARSMLSQVRTDLELAAAECDTKGTRITDLVVALGQAAEQMDALLVAVSTGEPQTLAAQADVAGDWLTANRRTWGAGA